MEKVADRVTLDTTFLIHLLRGHSPAVTKAHELREQGYEACTTPINVFELYTGAYKSEKNAKTKDVASLLTDLRLLNLGEKEAKASARIFTQHLTRGKAIDLRDTLVAGTMLSNDCHKIITRNVQPFTQIEDIEVLTY